MVTPQEQHSTDPEREGGAGVEKRSHPTQTRHHHHGVVGSDAAAGTTSTAAGLVGSPVIAHLSKGRRFSGKLR